MSQLTSADYDLSIAGIEIILLVAAAFIAGALLCYLLRLFGLCCRRSSSAADNETEVEINHQPVINMPRDPVLDSATGQYPAMNTAAVATSNGGYEADIGSLIRSDGEEPQRQQRTTTVSSTSSTNQVSFEERARAKLADLRTTNNTEVTDYTVDIPVPDDKHIDDLKKLEGIGPGIEKILNEAGIKSYAKLATMDRNYLKELLEASGSEFGLHEPKSWPYQAELAAKNNWNRLKEYQDFLLADRK